MMTPIRKSCKLLQKIFHSRWVRLTPLRNEPLRAKPIEVPIMNTNLWRQKLHKERQNGREKKKDTHFRMCYFLTWFPTQIKHHPQTELCENQFLFNIQQTFVYSLTHVVIQSPTGFLSIRIYQRCTNQHPWVKIGGLNERSSWVISSRGKKKNK